ncbi:MAG TPA: hypothetical protein VFH74_16210 [Gaiellales bacterium]|nr:hypothetical protein [Gaiellales bacterium]
MADSRVEIGFEGGLIISAKLPEEEWSRLEQALREGSGMVSFTGEGVAHHVDVSKICYVRRETHVGRVGF